MDGFKKFQRLRVKELLLQTVWKLFRKFLSEVEICIMWSSIQVLPNQASKRLFYTFEDIEYESPMRRYIKKPSEASEQIQFKG